MRRKADLNRVEILEVKGEKNLISVMLDEDYLIVGSHVDENTRNKITNGEYIDFAKLIPKDKIMSEEDHRMEMINKNGMSFWVPVSDRESSSITGFSKWEQAFHVFSNIYTHYYPDKAGDLIQYNHVIYSAAQSFIWENVYRYDREFRMHLGRHHPHRSWSTILQQVWTMCMRDKVTTPNHHNHGSGPSGAGGNARRKICFNFNKGICTFGQRCKFDHKCSFCKKFGHGAFNCRKAKQMGASGNGGDSRGGDHDHRDDKGKDRWDKYERELQKLNQQLLPKVNNHDH